MRITKYWLVVAMFLDAGQQLIVVENLKAMDSSYAFKKQFCQLSVHLYVSTLYVKKYLIGSKM